MDYRYSTFTYKNIEYPLIMVAIENYNKEAFNHFKKKFGLDIILIREDGSGFIQTNPKVSLPDKLELLDWHSVNNG